MAAGRHIITGPTSFVVGPISDDDLDEVVVAYALNTKQTLHDALLDVAVIQRFPLGIFTGLPVELYKEK